MTTLVGPEVTRSALLIIDMQNDIVNSHRPSEAAGHPKMGHLIAQLALLREAFREAELPVIFTRVAYRPSYADCHASAPARSRSSLKENEIGSAVVDELRPREDEYVVVKRRIGAFYQTDLELLLRGLGTKALTVTGTSLPRAVESTVREAHSRDIDCMVVSDAAYAESEDEHRHCLGVLSRYGFARAVTSRDVFEALGAPAAPLKDMVGSS